MKNLEKRKFRKRSIYKRTPAKFDIGDYVRSKRGTYKIEDMLFNKTNPKYFYKVRNLKSKCKYWVEHERAHKQYNKVTDNEMIKLLYD